MQMKNSIKIQSKILAGFMILMLYSCSEKKWDEYYNKPVYQKEGSIMDIVAGTSDYKEFSGLLRKTGYDSLLRSNQMLTLFALKNGSFTGVDTTSNIVALKKIIGMHIMPSALYNDKMDNNNVLSLSGKALKFAVTQDGQTVNNIKISSIYRRVSNGVIHDVVNVIMPLPNLYDFVLNDPGLSIFKSYIDSSFTSVVDPVRNIEIGFDTLGLPVYKTPIIYNQNSDYMSLALIDSEMVFSTIFMPTATVFNNLYSKMLVARGGDLNLIVPRMGTNHGDTTIGYYFIPKETAYKGDSAVLRDYVFKNAVVKKEVSKFESGSNIFTNISGNQFGVNQNQIITNLTKKASNGYIYTLSDITLPDFVYRKTFMFSAVPKIPDPSNPSQQIVNPGIVYRNGVNSYPPFTTATATYDNMFRFKQIGSELDIIMPYVMAGNYKVTLVTALWYRGSISGSGTFDAYYRTTKLLRFISSSAKVNTSLGLINVPANGPVKFTFKAVQINGNGALPLSAVILEPVDTP